MEILQRFDRARCWCSGAEGIRVDRSPPQRGQRCTAWGAPRWPRCHDECHSRLPRDVSLLTDSNIHASGAGLIDPYLLLGMDEKTGGDVSEGKFHAGWRSPDPTVWMARW